MSARTDRPRTSRPLRAAQILVLFAAALVVVCAVAAFSIDVGNMVLSRTRLQNAADAAALAGTLELWERQRAGADEASAREAAGQEAARVVAVNYPEAGAEVVFGSWESGSFAPAETTVAADAAKVRAFRSEGAPGGPLATFFGALFDFAEVDLSASGTARLGVGGMVPFGVWEEDIVPDGQTMTMYNNSSPVPGCFGLLDFDGGDHSAEEAKYWTRYGYDGPFDMDPDGGQMIVEGTTGLNTSVKAGVEYHIAEGDVVFACIYRTVWGQGSNAYFEVVGLVALVITEHGFVDAKEDEYDHVSATVVDAHLFSEGLSDDVRRNFMRLRLVE